MKLDRRTRDDVDVPLLDPGEFFGEVFAEFPAERKALAAAGVHRLGARNLALRVGDSIWTLEAAEELRAVAGCSDGAIEVGLTPRQLSDWLQQQTTFTGLMTARSVDKPRGTAKDLAAWDAAWLALLEGWPVIEETTTFTAADGSPLDLGRVFGPDDPPEDISHFFREAGYLHLRGWLAPEDMVQIAQDIDRAVAHYREGDGRSWWATVDDGTRRCVRLLNFVEHSPTTADLLRSESWRQVREVVGGPEPLVQKVVEGNCIEALIKPLAVVEGISDVPWHRDCNLGRHAYMCANVVTGLSVDPGDAEWGMLRVVAGSHRVNMPAYRAWDGSYLPIVPLVTERGDISVHQSCTLHEATPPTRYERRVMYSGFELPPRRNSEPVTVGGQALWTLRNRAHTLVSQPGSPLAGRH
ncbi:MAG TPA: phytanoyl-CoA dioxygenase family protein [Mycobacteriales bacterium]|nr:phytanoyl-CoA dioxygenase family protein [Mycobacteriales bacterium]